MTTLPIGDTCEDVAAQRCFRTEVSSSDIQTNVWCTMMGREYASHR